MKRAVLVNGVPASGKSTVARGISVRTGWLLLILDRVKEPFFDELGIGDREFRPLSYR
jgi:predicted kinase